MGRISAPGGFGWARHFSTRLSDCASAPTIIGLISDSMLMIRSPRSGQGPNGHSSVITTQAGRFLVLPLVRDGRLGTGTALWTPTIATIGGVKLNRERVSSRV